MPVDFLTPEQKLHYGRYVDDPSDLELARYFYLDDADKEFIAERRTPQNKLGFALQIVSARYLGTFISIPMDVPIIVQHHVARQLLISDVSALNDCASRETIKREHATLIRKKYGYHDFSEPPWAFRLSRLLYSKAWINNERPGLLFEFSITWLIQHKVLLPGITTLSRLISEVRERVNNRLWQSLYSLPSIDQKIKLKTLLQVPVGTRYSVFDQFRKGPVTVSSTSFNLAIKRYQALKEFGAAELDFSGIPPVRLNMAARHAGVISMNKIARMPEKRQIAFLLAFVNAYEVIALDDALDVMDMLITDIASEAKKSGIKKRLRSLKDMDKSALTLAQVCTVILDESTADNQLREVIFNRFPKPMLESSISTINKLARPSNSNFQDEMVEQYGRIRRCLSQLLYEIEYKAAPAGKNTFISDPSDSGLYCGFQIDYLGNWCYPVSKCSEKFVVIK